MSFTDFDESIAREQSRIKFYIDRDGKDSATKSIKAIHDIYSNAVICQKSFGSSREFRDKFIGCIIATKIYLNIDLSGDFNKYLQDIFTKLIDTDDWSKFQSALNEGNEEFVYIIATKYLSDPHAICVIMYSFMMHKHKGDNNGHAF